MTTLAPESLTTVFASSDGDTGIVHRISSALAESLRVVSPTDFHNSVHNAAAGYWSIAAHTRLPSVSLSAGTRSFAAGLLEAAAQVETETVNSLLVMFDVKPPAPLNTCWCITDSAAFALVLSSHRTINSLAVLDIEMRKPAQETVMDDAGLESLRLGNPAARALPVLAQLARRQAGAVLLDGAGEQSVYASLAPL